MLHVAVNRRRLRLTAPTGSFPKRNFWPEKGETKDLNPLWVKKGLRFEEFLKDFKSRLHFAKLNIKNGKNRQMEL